MRIVDYPTRHILVGLTTKVKDGIVSESTTTSMYTYSLVFVGEGIIELTDSFIKTMKDRLDKIKLLTQSDEVLYDPGITSIGFRTDIALTPIRILPEPLQESELLARLITWKYVEIEPEDILGDTYKLSEIKVNFFRGSTDCHIKVPVYNPDFFGLPKNHNSWLSATFSLSRIINDFLTQ